MRQSVVGRSARAIASIALVLAGCVAPIPSDMSSAPAEPVVPRASATSDAPSLVPDPGLDTVATLVRDDVRVTLELDSAPLRVGEPGWATVTIENLGDGVVMYRTDGCEIPGHVSARLVGEWIAGREHAGIAAEFKAAALEEGGSDLAFDFESEQFAGQDIGCADVGVVSELGAGAHVEQRSVWLGWDDVPVPTSPVEILASFPFLGRGRVEPDRQIEPIVVRLAGAVVGGEPWPWLTPAQAIDAALADAEFRDWIAEFPSETWVNPTTTLDPEAGIWRVGLIRDAPGRALSHILTLDARTGRVLGREYP